MAKLRQIARYVHAFTTKSRTETGIKKNVKISKQLTQKRARKSIPRNLYNMLTQNFFLSRLLCNVYAGSFREPEKTNHYNVQVHNKHSKCVFAT